MLWIKEPDEYLDYSVGQHLIYLKHCTPTVPLKVQLLIIYCFMQIVQSLEIQEVEPICYGLKNLLQSLGT